MPRFLGKDLSAAEKYEVGKKAREENDYGSIASLLRNEVSLNVMGKRKSHMKSTIQREF